MKTKEWVKIIACVLGCLVVLALCVNALFYPYGPPYKLMVESDKTGRTTYYICEWRTGYILNEGKDWYWVAKYDDEASARKHLDSLVAAYEVKESTSWKEVK